jgi:hypothetical protein
MQDYITTDLQKQEGTLCTGFIWEGTGGGFLSARYWTQFNRSFIAHNLSMEQSLSSEANSSSRQSRNYPYFMVAEVHYCDHNSLPTALIQGLSVIISWLQRVSNRPVRILVTMKNELLFPFTSVYVSATHSWDLIRLLSKFLRINVSKRTSDDVCSATNLHRQRWMI